jgi:hypothetical protein
MEEHMNVNRNQYVSVYGINGYSVKITRNCHKDISAPIVLVGQNKNAFIHNLKVKKNSAGNIILYCETNEKYVCVYSNDSTSVSFASDDTPKDSRTLPAAIVILELIELSQSGLPYASITNEKDKTFNTAFADIRTLLL